SSRTAPRAPGRTGGPAPDRKRAPARRARRRGGSASRLRATAGDTRSPRGPSPFRSSYSWPTSFDSCRLEQLRQFFSRVEHARLHGVLGDSNDLGHFLYGFLVVVDQIDDLLVFRRELFQALPQHRTLVLLLQRDIGGICRVLDGLRRLLVQFLVRFLPQ